MTVRLTTPTCPMRERLVGEVEFRQWTSDHRLRHPSWRGLRDDLEPEEVRHPGR